MNCLDVFSPRPIWSSSSCAALVIRCRAVTVSRAGFDAVGKTVCGALRLKVLEWERVGFGFTGPMERREAAKSGSRPSRSIAVKVLAYWGSVLVVCEVEIVAMRAVATLLRRGGGRAHTVRLDMRWLFLGMICRTTRCRTRRLRRWWCRLRSWWFGSSCFLRS